MAVELKVPPLGESITEAVVGKWNKKKGDAVAADEPLVVLETDKVTIDVPAPAAGAIAAIAFNEGDKVRVGDVLGTIEAGAGAAAPAPRPPPLPPAAAPAAPGPPARRRITPDRPARWWRRTTWTPPSSRARAPAGASPRRTCSASCSAPPRRPPRPPSAPRPRLRALGPRPRADREERVKMTPLRRRVAERLLQAQSSAAILTTFNEVDMGAVMALRKQYNEQLRGQARREARLHELLRARRASRPSRPSPR